MAISKQNSSVSIYFFLWCLYYLQGTFYESGSMISKALLVIVLAMSLIHFFRSHVMGLCKSMKWLDLLLVMFLVYGFVGVISGYVINVGGMTNVGYIKSILISFLPIYSFYYFTRKGKIEKSHLFLWTIVLIVVYSLAFINHQLEQANNPLMYAMNEAEEATNNTGYLIVSLIPFLVFYNNKSIIQYSFLALIMLVAISSMKRGAILVGAIMMIVLILTSLKDNRIGRKIWISLLLISVTFIGIYFVEYLLSTSDFFNFRIEMTREGDSSNRDEIYKYFFNYFINQSNVFHFLFGSGANATARIYGMFAHNDWLELAIDQGLFGLIIYLLFWIALYMDWRKTKFDNDVYIAFGLSLVYMLFRSFVSMSFLMIPLSCSILVGYGLAKSCMTYK